MTDDFGWTSATLATSFGVSSFFDISSAFTDGSCSIVSLFEVTSDLASIPCGAVSLFVTSSIFTSFDWTLSFNVVGFSILFSAASASCWVPKYISEPIKIDAVPTVNFLIEYLFNLFDRKSTLLFTGPFLSLICILLFSIFSTLLTVNLHVILQIQ